jgi:hypothetical protein
VTFDPVPLYIICVRLGPSIPGVYVNPGFWTPKIRVLHRASWEPHFSKGFLFSQGKMNSFPMGKWKSLDKM